MSLIGGFAEPVKIRRFRKTEYANGKAIEPKFKEFTIRASVQPLDPDETLNEDQGQRDKKAVRIYADDELINVDEKTKQKGDQVLFAGEWFEIQKVEHWRGSGFFAGILHYKAIAYKVSP